MVEDRVNNALADRETVYANDVPGNWKLWLGVPVKVFKKYAKNNDDKQKALELINNDQYGFTAIYDEDMNFKRSLLMWWMNHNYVKNFRKYFKENKG